MPGYPSIIGSIGSGAAAGAGFGPWGAAIGGGLGLLSGLWGASQTSSANKDAIAAQKMLADRMFYMGMPKYGKRARSGMWNILDKELANYNAGGAQIMSPDLQNEQYANLRRTFMEPYTMGRKSLEQGMVNRGLEYGNVLPTALGRYDQRAADTLASAGTDIATKAATLNYGAQQDQLNRLLGTYTGLFKQGDAVKNAWMGQGMQAMGDANTATAANTSNYWSSLSSLLGNTLGGIDWSKMYFGNQPGRG